MVYERAHRYDNAEEVEVDISQQVSLIHPEGHGWEEPPVPPDSDAGERGGGDEADGEGPREVVVLATAAVTEVERVLLLTLVGVAEEDDLTQEGVHDHVLVVDLLSPHREEEEEHQLRDQEEEEEEEEKAKIISSPQLVSAPLQMCFYRDGL